MTLKVVVIGKTGQVAVELQRIADPALTITAVGRETVDLADPGAAGDFVAQAEADVVVNAAAYTAVDKAEEEETLATRVNGAAPGAMAEAAARRDIPFLHISTDYVFDGAGDRPWREDDPTGPLGAYGRSKLAGEAAVRAVGGRHVVLRTAWVFSGHGANFVATMLRVGKSNPRLTVVDDQRGGPTAAADIAATLVHMAKRLRAGDGPAGVFHYAGTPAVSWRGFAEEIFAQTNWDAKPEVAPIRTENWPTPAARPANSVLDCQRILEGYGLSQPDWKLSLTHAIAELEGTRS